MHTLVLALHDNYAVFLPSTSPCLEIHNSFQLTCWLSNMSVHYTIHMCKHTHTCKYIYVHIYMYTHVAMHIEDNWWRHCSEVSWVCTMFVCLPVVCVDDRLKVYTRVLGAKWADVDCLPAMYSDFEAQHLFACPFVAFPGEVVRVRDVKNFPLSLWLIFFICVTYYVSIFPFISLGTWVRLGMSVGLHEELSDHSQGALARMWMMSMQITKQYAFFCRFLKPHDVCGMD